MKRLSILFSLFIGLAMSQSVWAYKEADLRALLSTNSCHGCDLSRANLSGANLNDAFLWGANLKRANLSGANLSNADLTYADLTGANLSGADFTRARVSNADFTGANLSGAKFCGTFNWSKPYDNSAYDNSGCAPGETGRSTGRTIPSWATETETEPQPQPTPTVRNPVLTIRSNVSGYVYLNSQPQGNTPIEIEIPKGRYTVQVDKSGYYPFQKSVNVQRDTEVYASLSKKEEAQPTPTPTPDSSSLRLAGTGTAFVVSKNYLLTASHVIDECKEVSIRHSHEETDVAIAAWDETNDVGLLKSKKSFQHIAKFRGGKPIRLGDTVVNYGYPLFGELSDHAKISKGEINSLAGMANDSSVFQYDAATQPGNSGGPVLDLSGNVVGIVSSGLSKRYADATGHIAQNVNFAVKSYVAEGFLSSNGVDFERAESVEELRTADIAEKAERFTVLVGCWQ